MGRYPQTPESEMIRELLGRFEIAGAHSEHTPERIERYLRHWAGWPEQAPFRFTLFPNEKPKVDQLIVVPSITFWSCCSHHLLPFHGVVTVGYIPDGYIIGLSKVSLVVRWIAQKPQVQEHLAHEIAAYLDRTILPLGLAVDIRAWHTCQMLDVGPDAPQMVTTVLRGVLKNAPARAEFLRRVPT